MEFIVSLPDFGEDLALVKVANLLKSKFADRDGICYYKHPVVKSTTNSVPELTILIRDYEPMALKCLSYTIDEIEFIDENVWRINKKDFESPVLDLEDYIVNLEGKFKKERSLRHLFKPISAIAMPLISKSEFETKMGKIPEDVKFIWKDLNLQGVLINTNKPLTNREWLLSKSVFQGISPLNRFTAEIAQEAKTFGDAIKILEKDIALLDEEQHKVAVQIAPGPLRIRGLAGTGKTVILAMKAANIHLRFPAKKILFTFNTQSLYNQAKTLITKFYRVHSDTDPDWDVLHIRHAWGGVNRPGVYSELCRRHGSTHLTLPVAQKIDPEFPFKACCKHALGINIGSMYDYILVDEAQDFPKEFFYILYKLADENKRIYWAYDELQTLSNIEVPRPEELFGIGDDGKPLVTLDGEDYLGGIEKDFVLHRSYRCPQEILMLAHAIGLGIHAPRGCVQMLTDKTSWLSIGYKIEQGDLKKGDKMVIYRPPENSPNKIKQIYKGENSLIRTESFDNREAELEWVANSIYDDIFKENIRPEQIVVISLDSVKAKKYLANIQSRLLKYEIQSTIPGLIDMSWEFAEKDMVTLSTIHRAKGNECPVVYIISFDSLYEYTTELENRNKAFTSISRSKGWVRISGSGKEMNTIKKEINSILNDIPWFKFEFPNMEKIRRLDASETSRRRKEVKKASDTINSLKDIDPEALKEVINKQKPFELKLLKDLLSKTSGGISDEN